MHVHLYYPSTIKKDYALFFGSRKWIKEVDSSTNETSIEDKETIQQHLYLFYGKNWLIESL